MGIPRMNAQAALNRPQDWYGLADEYAAPEAKAGVSPQFCVSGPCLGLPSGRFCVTLPILGRRCVTIPSFGRWRVRCCTRFGWPPVSCGISHC